MQNYAFVTEGRVYVSDSLLVSPNAIYNPATTYCKGGTILHMLRFELGDDSLFFKFYEITHFCSRTKMRIPQILKI